MPPNAPPENEHCQGGRERKAANAGEELAFATGGLQQKNVLALPDLLRR